MKAFTDIEQSRKLSEILPIKSADMEYILEQWIDEKTHRHKEGYYEIPVVKVDDDCPLQPITLPCWGLTALLDVLFYPQLSKDKLGSGKEGWMVSAYPDNCRYDSCWHDNPVDACYEMIIKLHEQNIL